MNYSDIAAYPEGRLSSIIRRLYSDPQFRTLLAKATVLPWLYRKNDLDGVIQSAGNLKSVSDFQRFLLRLIRFNIKSTTDGLTCSGTARLFDPRSKLFLSNHRSIALDSVFLNYLLMQRDLPTVYSAAGDNLMQVPWIQHFIRLNKGFIVKRKVDDAQTKLSEAHRLSRYIHSLLDDGNDVWIAHRGGRAKDGDDATDSAVFSMLRMGTPFHTFEKLSEKLNIVPMSISWEQVPQDEILAAELAGDGTPSSARRDLANIIGEISNWKGRVHIAFGPPIVAERRRELVEALDREIQTNFRLWDANWLAYVADGHLDPDIEKRILDRIDFDRAVRVLHRADALPEKVRSILIRTYSNPVRNAVGWLGSVDAVFEDQEKKFALAEPAERQ